MIGKGDCGAIGGMKIGRGNLSTRRKPAPAPLCPPQIPLDNTRAAAVESQRPICQLYMYIDIHRSTYNEREFVIICVFPVRELFCSRTVLVLTYLHRWQRYDWNYDI
jgi:hypothetical protein